MAIRFGDRLGRLPQVVKVAQLVRYARQRAGNRFANRLLAVGLAFCTYRAFRESGS